MRSSKNSSPALRQLASFPRIQSVFFLKDYYDDGRYYRIYSLDGNCLSESISGIPEGQKCLGFGVNIGTNGSPLFAAYFSEVRESDEVAPDYGNSLYLIVDKRIYDFHTDETTARIRSLLFHRSFSVSVCGKQEYEFTYRWPIYREMFTRVFSDPFNFVSKDFFFEFLVLWRDLHRKVIDRDR